MFRTRDARLVRELATDPAIFPYIADDFFKQPEQWHVPDLNNEFLRCYAASDEDGPYGFGIFIAEKHTHWKAHIGFLPRAYGEKAILAFKEMISRMWKETSAQRITGEVSQENRRAIKFAVNAGFKEYGVNEKSLLRGGVLRDQVCLGISKPQ